MLFDRFFKKPTVCITKHTGHAGGTIAKRTDNHIPSLQLEYYDPNTEKPLTDKQVKSARAAGTLQPIFYNPNQSLDYIVIEGLCKNTIVGSIMNEFTQLIVGSKIHPEIELINPSGDSEKDQKQIEKHQDIIKELHAVENHINQNNDITFVEFVSMLIDSTNTFGRAALIYDSTTEYKGIPTTLKYAHPRDLSITVFHPDTWRLDSVLWFYGGQTPVKSDNLVYLWNPLVTAKYHNAWQYGGSMVLPMLEAAKTLRQIISVDFPAMAEATWSGMFFLTVRPQGSDEASKDTEYTKVVQNMVRGAPNVLLENPEDISFDSVDFSPKVDEFRDLTQFLIKYCMSTVGLPQSFDESDSNRSASRTKLQFVTNTVIAPIRERFGRQICRQTYQKWFETLHPDLTDEIRIKLVFDDLKISEWYDKIEAALEVDSRHKLKHTAFGKLADIPDYTQLIEPSAETHEGGQGEKPHNIQRDNSGKNLDVGIAKNKEGLA